MAVRSTSHVGAEAVYVSNRDELTALMGKKAYAVLVEYCQAHEEALLNARGAARQALAPHPADPQ